MSTKRKSKTKNHIVIITMLILIAAAFFTLRPKSDMYKSVEAKTGDIDTYYSFSGNIDAKNRQTVMSEKVMQISEIKVKEGEKVEKGDVLFTTTTEDKIKAGIDGEVAQINIEENEQVMAGISLMEVVDYGNLQINVKVDEYNVSDLGVGNEETVYIGAIDKEIKGTIESISKEGLVVNGVTYFTAVVDLEKDDAIKVGMSAEVKLRSFSVNNVVTLPVSVIQFDEINHPYVYLKDRNGKIVKADIDTGINDGTSVEIVNGINSGDTVYYEDTASSSANNMAFGTGNGGL
ncbi:MAG: HlyD family efflux transporter periplasmic adaptor subunit [Anaerocolumna sp.]